MTEKNYTLLADIYKTLITDETLLRLLYYPPESLADSIPDPLSDHNPNMLDKPREELWSIIQDAIKKVPPIESPVLKRAHIYIYPGKRTPNRQNNSYSKKQVIFDVVSHFDFEDVDFRSMRITDRLCELFVNKNVAGINKTEDAGGGQINGLPKGFVGYKNVFEFGSGAS